MDELYRKLREKALYRIVIHASAKIAEPLQVGARRRYRISNEGGRDYANRLESGVT